MVNKFTDLDQGGHGYPRSRAYLGPTLGWVDQLVKPATLVQQPLYGVQAGDSLIMVDTNVGFPTFTIVLPDVIAWIQQPAYQPATGFEKALWIKDIGGLASSSNIFIQPFTGQLIDKLSSMTIVQNRQLLRLYPIIEWNYPPGEWIGWFSG